MKIVAISDTHSRHKELKLPLEGDILIHAGDLTSRGTRTEAEDFMEWFAAAPFPHKILIAGNHDFFFEAAPPEAIARLIPDNVHYLNDSGVIIGGLNIWGSPVQPTFMNMAFNRERGKPIKKHWDLIPANTDVLITHGPLYGILDRTLRGVPAGCKDLLDKVLEIKPKLHICGHIHEAYGSYQRDEMLFLNASSWYMFDGPKNRPMSIDLAM